MHQSFRSSHQTIIISFINHCHWRRSCRYFSVKSKRSVLTNSSKRTQVKSFKERQKGGQSNQKISISSTSRSQQRFTGSNIHKNNRSSPSHYRKDQSNSILPLPQPQLKLGVLQSSSSLTPLKGIPSSLSSLSSLDSVGELDILYGSFRSSFVIISKPGGLSCQSLPPSDSVEWRLKQRYGCKQVFFPHRLDKHTSGILVIALQKKAADEMGKQLRNNEWKKKYRVLVNIPSIVMPFIDKSNYKTPPSPPPAHKSLLSPYLNGTLFNRSGLLPQGRLSSYLQRRFLPPYKKIDPAVESERWRKGLTDQSIFLAHSATASNNTLPPRRLHPFVPETMLYQSIDHSPAAIQEEERRIRLIMASEMKKGAKKEKIETGKLAETAFELVDTISIPSNSSSVNSPDKKVTEISVEHGTVRLGLYRAELLTGRPHQLRIHFADAGFPVVNCPYYNPYYLMEAICRYEEKRRRGLRDSLSVDSVVKKVREMVNSWFNVLRTNRSQEESLRGTTTEVASQLSSAQSSIIRVRPNPDFSTKNAAINSATTPDLLTKGKQIFSDDQEEIEIEKEIESDSSQAVTPDQKIALNRRIPLSGMDYSTVRPLLKGPSYYFLDKLNSAAYSAFSPPYSSSIRSLANLTRNSKFLSSSKDNRKITKSRRGGRSKFKLPSQSDKEILSATSPSKSIRPSYSSTEPNDNISNKFQEKEKKLNDKTILSNPVKVWNDVLKQYGVTPTQTDRKPKKPQTNSFVAEGETNSKTNEKARNKNKLPSSSSSSSSSSSPNLSNSSFSFFSPGKNKKKSTGKTGQNEENERGAGAIGWLVANSPFPKQLLRRNEKAAKSLNATPNSNSNGNSNEIDNLEPDFNLLFGSEPSMGLQAYSLTLPYPNRLGQLLTIILPLPNSWKGLFPNAEAEWLNELKEEKRTLSFYKNKAWKAKRAKSLKAASK